MLDKRERRAIREQVLADRIKALPDKRYGVIYADPPWRFEPYSRDTGLDRAADNHYPTAPVEMIKALPVASIAHRSCILFLWATAPMLPQALDVMTAWGFTYKSHCVWLKDKIGTGFWFRNVHEILLVGTTGTIPAPAPGEQFPSVLVADRRRHSQKPDEVIGMIDILFPHVPKIELYARETKPGWDSWGNEV